MEIVTIEELVSRLSKERVKSDLLNVNRFTVLNCANGQLKIPNRLFSWFDWYSRNMYWGRAMFREQSAYLDNYLITPILLMKLSKDNLIYEANKKYANDFYNKMVKNTGLSEDILKTSGIAKEYLDRYSIMRFDTGFSESVILAEGGEYVNNYWKEFLQKNGTKVKQTDATIVSLNGIRFSMHIILEFDGSEYRIVNDGVAMEVAINVDIISMKRKPETVTIRDLVMGREAVTEKMIYGVEDWLHTLDNLVLKGLKQSVWSIFSNKNTQNHMQLGIRYMSRD